MLAYVCYVTEPSCISVFCECERKQKFPFIIWRWIIWLSYNIRCLSLNPKNYSIFHLLSTSFLISKYYATSAIFRWHSWRIYYYFQNEYYMCLETEVTCMKTFVFITMAVFFYIIRTTKITANSFLKTKSFFLKNLTWMMPMC